MGMDWSTLPLDLLEMISRKVTDICDYSRFRAVCAPWRSAARPVNLPAQLPWLMLPCKPDTNARSFFLVSENKVCSHELPSEFNGKQILASSHGWLLLMDSHLSVSMLNPLTRAQIHLPSLLTGIESGTEFTRDEEKSLVRFWREEHNVCSSGLNHVLGLFTGNASFSSDPVSGMDFMVMIGCRLYPEFIFCRPGDETWMTVQTGTRRAPSDLTYYEGKFYVVDRAGNTAIFDANSPKKTHTLASPTEVGDYDKLYIAESAGKLLLVVRHHRRDWDSIDCADWFQVYELDRSEQPQWLRVSDMRDRMLFLDEHYALCFSSRDCSGCGGNCIYFIDSYRLRDSTHGGEKVHGVCQYDVKNGHVEKLPRYWNKWGQANWYAPAL